MSVRFHLIWIYPVWQTHFTECIKALGWARLPPTKGCSYHLSLSQCNLKASHEVLSTWKPPFLLSLKRGFLVYIIVNIIIIAFLINEGKAHTFHLVLRTAIMSRSGHHLTEMSTLHASGGMSKIQQINNLILSKKSDVIRSNPHLRLVRFIVFWGVFTLGCKDRKREPRVIPLKTWKPSSATACDMLIDCS